MRLDVAVGSALALSSGGPLMSSTEPPVTARWNSEEGKKSWYGSGKEYWANEAASNTGMLGGYQAVHPADMKDSAQFIEPFWPLEGAPLETRALDVGAGIGRISGGLLLKLADRVDLVEGCAKFVAQAREDLGWAGPRMERFIVADMQDFAPDAGRYHLIWIQWCIGQLPDDDLVAFLGRCRAALAPGGLIVIKDNVLGDHAAARALNSRVTYPMPRSPSVFAPLCPQIGRRRLPTGWISTRTTSSSTRTTSPSSARVTTSTGCCRAAAA